MSQTGPSATASVVAPLPLKVEVPYFSDLEIHQLKFCDDFCSFADKIRDELLRFPAWMEMRQHGTRSIEGVVNPARQNGLTSGHLTNKHRQVLPNCLRFRDQLQDNLEELCNIMSIAWTAEMELELNAMAYGEGAWLSPHTDRGRTATANDRLVAWMLYLTNPADGAWSNEHGGAVKLTARDGKTATLSPKFNRFAMFKVSSESVHEIEKISRQTKWEDCRLALSGWIRAPHASVEKGMVVYLKSNDYLRLRVDLETSLSGSIALYRLMDQQRGFGGRDTTQTSQLLEEYQRDYQAHRDAPTGTSFLHRASGPSGCITVLNEDKTIGFFGKISDYEHEHRIS